MSATIEQIRMDLAALTENERAELAHFLIHSLDQSADVDSADYDAELARRADEIKNGRAIGEPADNVFSELRAKYS